MSQIQLTDTMFEYETLSRYLSQFDFFKQTLDWQLKYRFYKFQSLCIMISNVGLKSVFFNLTNQKGFRTSTSPLCLMLIVFWTFYFCLEVAVRRPNAFLVEDQRNLLWFVYLEVWKYGIRVSHVQKELFGWWFRSFLLSFLFIIPLCFALVSMFSWFSNFFRALFFLNWE